MEHLDNILNDMEKSYSNINFNANIGLKVHQKIGEIQEKQNRKKIVGLSIVSLFMLSVLIFSKQLIPFDKLGQFFGAYFYICYSFCFMVFVVIIIINSQKFLFKVFKKSLIEKVNHHNVYFSDENNINIDEHYRKLI